MESCYRHEPRAIDVLSTVENTTLRQYRADEDEMIYFAMALPLWGGLLIFALLMTQRNVLLVAARCQRAT